MSFKPPTYIVICLLPFINISVGIFLEGSYKKRQYMVYQNAFINILKLKFSFSDSINYICKYVQICSLCPISNPIQIDEVYWRLVWRSVITKWTRSNIETMCHVFLNRNSIYIYQIKDNTYKN